jgi:hypothetical protein
MRQRRRPGGVPRTPLSRRPPSNPPRRSAPPCPLHFSARLLLSRPAQSGPACCPRHCLLRRRTALSVLYHSHHTHAHSSASARTTSCTCSCRRLSQGRAQFGHFSSAARHGRCWPVCVAGASYALSPFVSLRAKLAMACRSFLPSYYRGWSPSCRAPTSPASTARPC